jgi:AcrR family transcriptional regulator
MDVTYTPPVPQAATETPEPPSGRGRPRAAGRTEEILLATIELFEEVGYDHLRIQDVADRAGAGLATIYRRWPTKQALVADALRHKSQVLDEPRTGDPRTDLLRLYRTVAENSCGRRAEFLPGFLAAVRTDAGLCEAFADNIVNRVRAESRELLAEILGADCPHLDHLADLVPALVIFRSLIPGSPPLDPEQFPAEALDMVLACARGARE